MPYFIATVWTASAKDPDAEQPWFGREVRRAWADTEDEFVDLIRSEDANDECVIGPVGLSKDQSTYERDYSRGR